MLYCFDKRLNFDYTEGEIAVTKLNNNGIYYDSIKKIFTDYNGNEIDIKDKVIFSRTGSTQIYDMNREIEKNGGIPIVGSEEVKQVDSWPNHYNTKRKTIILTGRDLLDHSIITKIETEFGKEIFFKTREKDFHDIIQLDLLKDLESAFYKTLTHHLDDEFIISEKVNIESDKYGLKEYRCFVVNNQLMNISRMTVNLFHTVEEEIIETAQEIIKNLELSNYPDYYSFDIFVYKKSGQRVIDVVEFNPIHAAGLYLYNSVIEKSTDYAHKNQNNIAREFIDSIDECSTEGDVINDRDNDYNRPNSFSKDLRSICITGELGLEFTTYRITKKDYARHQQKQSRRFTLIEDDEDLFRSSGGEQRDRALRLELLKLLQLKNSDKEDSKEQLNKMLKYELKYNNEEDGN